MVRKFCVGGIFWGLLCLVLICLVLKGEVLSQSKKNETTSPQLVILQPTDQYEIISWSSDRPSILVRGTLSVVPKGYKLFVAVHPVQTDNVYSYQVPLSGGDWIAQAYLGDRKGGLPRDGGAFEIVAVLSEDSLPERFSEWPQQKNYYLSSIVTVKVKIISWVDKIVLFGKELDVSAPIVALCTIMGGLAGKFLGKRKK